MFNPEDFREYPTIVPIVEKLNKYLKKDKPDKVSQIIRVLQSLLQKKDLAIPVTYIFSIFAENDPSFLSNEVIKDIEPFLESDEKKLLLNTIIIIGFHLLENSSLIELHLSKFIHLLKVDSDEVLENAYYFLQKFVKFDSTLLCKYKSVLLERLQNENNEENQLTLIQFIENCSNFDFDELYQFKEVALKLVSQYQDKLDNLIISSLISKLSQLFSTFKDTLTDRMGFKELKKEIAELFIMKKFNFTKIAKTEGITLKEYLQNQKESLLINMKLTFYIRNQDDSQINYYEVEKDKLINFFDSKKKISKDTIMKTFSLLLDDDSGLEQFMKTLIKLNIIRGHFSELHYFYPYVYLHEDILRDIQEKGIVNFDKYNYIPVELLIAIIEDVALHMKQLLLRGKNGKVFYSQKKINQTINKEAAKTNVIDLQSYHKRLIEEEYTKLIKNLSKDYLSKYHENTQYLTNLGLINVRKEIDNSKIIGYFSINDVSKKLNVRESIIYRILKEHVDMRSGVFDKNNSTFYYSKFLNDKIYQINQIKNEEKRSESINQLANQLNIEKKVIFSKLEENLNSIGEEIKNQDEININEYLDKTGMNYGEFLNYVQDLGIDYFKKEDRIIINQQKINDAKNDIKALLIDKAKSENFILYSDLDFTHNIIEQLLHELQEANKIIGISYHEGEKMMFYTKKGIENLMLENQHLFSFQDLFLEKTLSESELQLLRTILEELMKGKRLNGTFDDENLIFSSNEVLFAQNYNGILAEFERTIKKYVEYFESEFGKIRNILMKEDETVFPHEIKIIQDIIDQVNYNYIHWRSGIEAYVRNANNNLLKKQGLTLRKYNAMKLSPDRKKDIKLFEEDPEVVSLLSEFKDWVKLFNTIELKYGNVIFYQKRLSTNPNNLDDRKKLNDLLIQLKLVQN